MDRFRPEAEVRERLLDGAPVRADRQSSVTRPSREILPLRQVPLAGAWPPMDAAFHINLMAANSGMLEN
ncbi:hypothetical protein WK36_20910 [Burkholderia cepacia]|nr:hypothetical protein WK36_20910 [Burkholderia cepacia]